MCRAVEAEVYGSRNRASATRLEAPSVKGKPQWVCTGVFAGAVPLGRFRSGCYTAEGREEPAHWPAAAGPEPCW